MELIVEVPQFRVMLAAVADQIPEVDERLKMEAPIFNVLAVPVVEKNVRALTGWLLVVRMPLLSNRLFVVAKASCKVHPPPIPLKVTVLLNDLPPLVTVLPNAVTSKLTGPVKVKFMPGTNVREP